MISTCVSVCVCDKCFAILHAAYTISSIFALKRECQAEIWICICLFSIYFSKFKIYLFTFLLFVKQLFILALAADLGNAHERIVCARQLRLRTWRDCHLSCAYSLRLFFISPCTASHSSAQEHCSKHFTDSQLTERKNVRGRTHLTLPSSINGHKKRKAVGWIFPKAFMLINISCCCACHCYYDTPFWLTASAYNYHYFFFLFQ